MIDVNYQSGKVGTLDKGEPSAIAPISYFQTATIDGSKLVAKDGKGEEASKFVGKDPAKFEVVLVNQSGKTMKTLDTQLQMYLTLLKILVLTNLK